MAKKKSNFSRIFSKKRRQLYKVLRSKQFGRVYVVSSLLILLVTTIFWAALSARIQQGNADQLANTYLFENLHTFQGALWPAQHSFLLKWPLFWLVSLFGASTLAFSIATVMVVIVTVASLVVLLHWIDRRPLQFGTLCLALGSVLLLIPTLPYASGLLPVNMGMLTTRNIEYIVYIGSLLLLLKAKKFWHWQVWLSLGLMSLLFASDKLFISLSMGGALILILAYAVFWRWQYVRMWLRWLVVSLVAVLISIAILWLLDRFKLAHIVSEGGSIGPYNFVSNWRDLSLGIIYAILGTLTNLGANPIFDVTIVKNILGQIWSRLFSVSNLAFATNLVILGVGLVAAFQLIRHSFILPKPKNKKVKTDLPLHVSLMLLASTIAAVVVFVATNHYYAVDSRYLAIALFAIFVTLAVFMRKRRFKAQRLVAVGLGLIIIVIIGTFTALTTYHQEHGALASIDKRNALVTSAIAHHPVSTLVGDYWRVLPTKLASNNKLNVLPLSACSQLRTTLTSTAWQPDLKHKSFAYILSFDRSLTDYPNCNLAQVTAHFGRPDSSVLIAGSLDKPSELLLFYDHGTAGRKQVHPAKVKETPIVGPISLDQIKKPTCDSPTIMNIVAHQDDDLLFMNPDLSQAITAGYCIRTIYVTSGDAGADAFYWLSREQGSKAAYSQMLGIRNNWIEQTVKLADRQFVTIANPVGNPRISLIFMHLPDGNIDGKGFKASHFESLDRLETGKIDQIQSTDGQSQYTVDQLTDNMVRLLQKFQPNEIHTQAPRNMSTVYQDHSDHLAVGRLTRTAYGRYNHLDIPIKYYIGYPIRSMAPNLDMTEFLEKQATFLVYSKFDGGVCQSSQMCDHTPTYHAYLQRQYQMQ